MSAKSRDKGFEFRRNINEYLGSEECGIIMKDDHWKKGKKSSSSSMISFTYGITKGIIKPIPFQTAIGTVIRKQMVISKSNPLNDKLIIMLAFKNDFDTEFRLESGEDISHYIAIMNREFIDSTQKMLHYIIDTARWKGDIQAKDIFLPMTYDGGVYMMAFYAMRWRCSLENTADIMHELARFKKFQTRDEIETELEKSKIWIDRMDLRSYTRPDDPEAIGPTDLKMNDLVMLNFMIEGYVSYNCQRGAITFIFDPENMVINRP